MIASHVPMHGTQKACMQLMRTARSEGARSARQMGQLSGSQPPSAWSPRGVAAAGDAMLFMLLQPLLAAATAAAAAAAAAARHHSVHELACVEPR